MASGEEAAYLIGHTDEVVGFMLAKFNHPVVSGLAVAGLFAAGMSSLASVTLIIGTAFVNDLWHVVKPLKPRSALAGTRMTMLFYSLLVFLFTLFPPAGIVELTAFSGAVFAASFFPSIFGGLYLRWGTDLGAISSMSIGMVVAVVWRFGLRFQFEALENIHEVIPAFIISLVVYLVVSKMSPHRLAEEAHLKKLFA